MSYTGSVPNTSRRTEDWRDTAACRNQDPELWFPKGETGTWGVLIEDAKAVCRRCPAAEACLQFALAEGIGHGIYGGLTASERASLRRSTTRRGLTPEDVAARADQAREPKPAKPRTMQSIFDDSTTRLHGGHLKWTGSRKINFRGKVYTPKQLCFIADRGHFPNGPVTSDCGNNECVLPQHLADTTERSRCGTRSGYGRHRKNDEEACVPCKQANTDADNLLRRTGTTKALV